MEAMTVWTASAAECMREPRSAGGLGWIYIRRFILRHGGAANHFSSRGCPSRTKNPHQMLINSAHGYSHRFYEELLAES